MRKCGFFDCNNQIKWQEGSCDTCQYRKENFVCDACLKDQGYNLYLLGGSVRNDINDTEIMLKRTRKMFSKVPSQLHNLLREMEQSLILNEEEKQAIVKSRFFRLGFLQEKNHGHRRDNIHFLKLCQNCRAELATKDKNFIETNPDVKKIAEKWKKNGENHLLILKEIDREIGRERYEKVMEELEQEIKEELPQEDELKESKDKNQNNDEKSEKIPFIVFFSAISILLLITLVVLINRKRKK